MVITTNKESNPKIKSNKPFTVPVTQYSGHHSMLGPLERIQTKIQRLARTFQKEEIIWFGRCCLNLLTVHSVILQHNNWGH